MRWLLTRCAVIATSVLHLPRQTRCDDSTMTTTTNWTTPEKGDTILVTGGAGFLGQHIISLLQTKVENIKEIRVLDLKQYENKLGHQERKPVRSFIGSVEDPNIVRKACHGVTSVYHIAGLISYGTFPDYDAMERVNVQGTSNVISACEQESVPRLIYCSTVDVVIGHDDIIDGTEETTAPPGQYLFPGYPQSKYKAECLILRANGTTNKDGHVLNTMALRANVMYGEQDPHYVINGLRNAEKCGKILFQVGEGNAKFQPAYVGNTAWAFLCADKALSKKPSVAGQFYFIPDDTPIQSTFNFMTPYLEARGFRLSYLRLPYTFTYKVLQLAEMVVKFLSPFVKLRLPTESYSLKYINMDVYFKNTKAREMLGFTPIFTPRESREKSLKYYKNVKLD